VGRTEQQLKADGRAVQGGQVPVRGQRPGAGRWTTAEGFVKVLADAATDEHPGRAHHRPPTPSELIAEAVVAMEFGASAEDIASHLPPASLDVRSRCARLHWPVDKRALNMLSAGCRCRTAQRGWLQRGDVADAAQHARALDRPAPACSDGASCRRSSAGGSGTLDDRLISRPAGARVALCAVRAGSDGARAS
jgi:hypothetical protein